MVVAQYLLAFREVLEAALLSAIILAFLTRTGRAALTRYAWYGILGAIAASLVLGTVVFLIYGQVTGAAKPLFEGIAALVAVAVLTSMILWMALKGRLLKQEIETRVEAAVTRNAVFGLAAVTFVLVAREGLETVLFLTPYLTEDPLGTLGGSAAGVVAGTALAYGVFRLGVKLDIRRFFYFTSLLLVLIAGGLVGYGIHELIEAGAMQGVDFGVWGEPAYALPIASDSLLGHKGAIGSIFAVMFGYTVKPEWARVIGHAAYLAVALPLVVLIYRRPQTLARFARRVRALFRPSAGNATASRNP
ncbi:MAG TPA: FTR1 family protein [Thermoplasmata archaeon]|nr:FTR1 family protein [Thermoplasmata archaeon]